MCSSESETTIKDLKGVNLVEQILRQGQRLRNSMVKSILDNDPFSRESNLCSMDEKEDITIEEKHKFLAYLRGEHMTRNEEKKVLETFRAMSDADIIDVTERSYQSDFSCNCDTCKEYYKHNLSCDFNHSKNVLCGNREKYKVPKLNLNEQNENDLYLKYVDSLKVMVHSVVLNQEGVRKLYGGGDVKQKIKYPLSVGHTYFLEYKIPYVISKGEKTKSKVDSGLNSGNFVRMCSKKSQGETVIFKQISLHDVCNLNNVDLSTINIKFQVSSRTYRQKTTNILGSAKFNMSSFMNSKNLTINEDLLLMMNVEAPIVIGKVKVTLELGLGQSHFGADFLKAISIEDKETCDTKHVNTEIFSDNDELVKNEKIEKESERRKPIELERDKEKMVIVKKPLKKIEKDGNKIERSDVVKKNVEKINTIKISDVYNVLKNNQVLFGFFCVTEACYEEIGDTCISCIPFSNYDTVFSRVVPQSCTPTYNFQQTVPFVYDESFLNRLRDNFMVFEFWNKCDCDLNIGVIKINLQQFYTSYRNPVIAKYLERNQLPVIGCDWWEPICDPLSGEIHGEAQVLVALGTEIQIHNLRTERGFVGDTVTAKYKSKINKKVVKSKEIIRKQSRVEDNKQVDKKVVPELKTVDVGIQSDIKMDGNNLKQNDIRQNENAQSISSLLKNLIELNNRNYVENSTNTEVMVSSPTVGKTSDLLDTLQEALAIPKPANSFKAHVLIENALHLPFRKKSKTKKSRGKNAKYEEILPSTYVSFETASDDVHLTPVVQKNKNPVWNYNCDVELPVDLLTNNEKRLIFKVWKKSNCATHPNTDTDTVIGFAGLDLTVLTVGMPNVSGWFNILDFASKCNGQIKITVTPQENVKRHNHNQKLERNEPSVSTAQPDFNIEEPSEILSRALKRKFTELDEITQRLRLRLSHVTNDESDTNDEFADEFERDINTLCEEDIEVDDFNEVASNYQLCSENECKIDKPEKAVDPLDRHLVESRLKLDTLFEKLALLTNNDPTQVFNSRHISGCSVSQDQTDPHLHKLPQDGSSSSSSLNSCVEGRLAPDGAGNK